MGPSGAVRVGDFKLVEAYETGAVELYDLSRDLGEQNNLAETMPEKTKEMLGRLHEWHQDLGAELRIGGSK